MTPSLEGWPTKAKEAPSPHEVKLSPLDTNPVFQCLGEDNARVPIEMTLVNTCGPMGMTPNFSARY